MAFGCRGSDFCSDCRVPEGRRVEGLRGNRLGYRGPPAGCKGFFHGSEEVWASGGIDLNLMALERYMGIYSEITLSPQAS